MNQSNWKGALLKPLWEEQSLQNAKKNNKTTKKKSSDRRRLAKTSKKQHSENTDKWHLCKAGSFSYGESPRTPPLEGTSLHRWNNDVERPWGILSLFTTCLQLWVQITLPLAATSAEHAPKSSRQNTPQKAAEKKEETYKTLKRRS